VTEAVTYGWYIQQLLGQVDRSGTEDARQFTAGIILGNLKKMEKGLLFDVSEPHL
jgi:hypothetical protein